MRTEHIIETLEKANDSILEFVLPNGHPIRSDYHITEFKNTSIQSVDCGGKTNEWKELVIQLWEPPVKGDDPQMTAGKAVNIMAKVEKSLALFRGVDVKFEFGNSDYRMAQHSISSITEEDGRLVIQLTASESECKGLSSGACGAPEAEELLFEMGKEAEASCTPGGGCC